MELHRVRSETFGIRRSDGERPRGNVMNKHAHDSAGGKMSLLPGRS